MSLNFFLRWFSGPENYLFLVKIFKRIHLKGVSDFCLFDLAVFSIIDLSDSVDFQTAIEIFKRSLLKGVKSDLCFSAIKLADFVLYVRGYARLNNTRTVTSQTRQKGSRFERPMRALMLTKNH